MTVGDLRKVLDHFNDNTIVVLEFNDVDYDDVRGGIYSSYVDTDPRWGKDDVFVLSVYNRKELESICEKKVMWEEVK